MMIDLKLLKENPQVIKEMLKNRNLDFPIDELINLDKKRRELIVQTQEIKHKKNNLANSIAIKKKNKHDPKTELEEMRVV
jgi:seryl-tRNA synthetase